MAIEDKFIEDLRKQIEDEKTASDEYQNLAMTADKLGHKSAAKSLREIAEDEKRHSVRLRIMAETITTLSSIEFAGLQRPFPQTYDDWADLGIDIGAKDPNIADEVQDMLTRIYVGGPLADDAKKWLVEMAGEVGVT